MHLSDLKISTRLGLAFSLMVLLALVSGGLALRSLQINQQRIEQIVTYNGVVIEHSNDVASGLQVVTRAVATILLLDDKAEQERQLAVISKAREAYNRSLQALKAMQSSAEGKAIQTRIEDNFAAARTANQAVLALVREGKRDEANAALRRQAMPATDKLLEVLEENLHLQEQNSARDYAQAQDDYAWVRNMLLGALALSVGLGALAGWRVTRSITVQLGAEPGVVHTLANSVAQGDLSTAVRLKPGDTASMMARLVDMQASLSRVVSSVRHGAEGVATASAEIAQGNNDLSARTEQQAAALQQTAASMEQFRATVKQNADNARQADQFAQGASSVAIKGGEVVGEVVATMRGINDSSRKIADIIGVIDSIAFQTNILALNAAVEAARAGEQGRGFAVVASEVRSLASRSADAAKQIKTLITESVDRVEQGTLLVDRAGATMTEVVNSIRRVTDIMGEITAASSEQSVGVNQIGDAVTQMDHATQQNSALVEESAAAAQSLQGQAQQLVGAVAVFKLHNHSAAAAS